MTQWTLWIPPLVLKPRHSRPSSPLPLSVSSSAPHWATAVSYTHLVLSTVLRRTCLATHLNPRNIRTTAGSSQYCRTHTFAYCLIMFTAYFSIMFGRIQGIQRLVFHFFHYMRSNITVSYTHLDVYKRQGIEKLYKTVDTLREFDPKYINITTVSYTHLDVYKRQVLKHLSMHLLSTTIILHGIFMQIWHGTKIRSSNYLQMNP